MSSTSRLALVNDTLLTQSAKKRRPFPFDNERISACITGHSDLLHFPHNVVGNDDLKVQYVW